LAFDIAQFFPFLNHNLLPLILDKAGFNSRISSFFSNYLIDRKTQHIWNKFVFPSFKIDINMGQGFTLFYILSVLYITPIFHIFKKITQNLSPPIFVSSLSFVDDGFFVSQKKSYKKSNTNIFCSYSIISSFFETVWP